MVKVIFCGFSKCGTKTMAAALTTLGYRVCDFMDNFENHQEEWSRVFTTGCDVNTFRRMFSRFDALTDLPSCFFWEEISQAFPHAKLIFSERNEEDWWKSMRKQIESGDGRTLMILNMFSPTSVRLRSWGRKMGTCVFGLDFTRNYAGKTPLNEMIMRMAYRRHNTYFLQNAPKEKTLIYEMGSGWEPLCHFLRLPLPSVTSSAVTSSHITSPTTTQPFPHLNKRASLYSDLVRTNPTFHRIIREMIFFLLISLLILLLLFHHLLVANSTVTSSTASTSQQDDAPLVAIARAAAGDL